MGGGGGEEESLQETGREGGKTVRRPIRTKCNDIHWYKCYSEAHYFVFYLKVEIRILKKKDPLF